MSSGPDTDPAIEAYNGILLQYRPHRSKVKCLHDHLDASATTILRHCEWELAAVVLSIMTQQFCCIMRQIGYWYFDKAGDEGNMAGGDEGGG